MINYILAAIIAFSGLAAGKVLSIMTKEELKPGRKYFLFVQKLTLSLTILFFGVYLYQNIILLIIALVLFALVLSFRKLTPVYITASYTLFLFILFFSINIQRLFMIESTLIFLFGLTTSSIR